MDILNVKNLSVYTKDKKTKVKLVNNLSFNLKRGECLGVLGESGSGKSITCKAIMGLLDDKNFHIEGEAIYKEQDLLIKNKEFLRKLRGKKIAMILQNPTSCFDPLYTIEYQMFETFKEHLDLKIKDIRKKSIEILNRMKIRNPEDVLEKYPHQLSGGMLQRIMIGIAMAMDPEIIIADEPTTAIDAITQYEIMNEFVNIKNNHNVSMIFVSHDIGVISKIADKVIVMNNGNTQLSGYLDELFSQKKDNFTRNLIDKKISVMERYRDVLKRGE